MTEAALWLALAVIGCICLAIVQRLGQAWAKAGAVRIAGLVFVAAGSVQAKGWIGDGIGWCVDRANEWGGDAGRWAFGTAAVVWIAAAGLCAAWLAGMLPKKVFNWDPPDWLMVSGVFLPSFVQQIPGPFGEFFTWLFASIHDGVVGFVTGLFS